jgi:hypothetical protein
MNFNSISTYAKRLVIGAFAWLAVGTGQLVIAGTPQEQLSAYGAQAGASGRPERGRQLFSAKHGREWSCVSCHGEQPVGIGRHALTGKSIGPMAPAANGERFTNPAKTEKWFRRNCNDVLARECTAQEKADVISWLISLQP